MNWIQEGQDNCLASWCRVLLKKLLVAQLLKKFFVLIQPEGSLPCSQNVAMNSTHSLMHYVFQGIWNLLTLQC